MKMRYLDIFLSSSSDELKNDRAELVNYIRNLNDTIYEKRNFRIRIHPLEFLNESFDSWIEDSDYFYVLMQGQADEKAVETFEKAYSEFKKQNSPCIQTYFKKCENPRQEVKDFMKRVDSLQHFFNEYDHIDSVKLNFLYDLAAERKTEVDLKYKNGKLYINDIEFNEINLKNIPSYIKNKFLNELKAKVEAAQCDFKNAKSEQEKLQASKVWNESLKEMNAFEKELCQISLELFQMVSNPSKVSTLLKEAIREFEQGNLDVALSLLDDGNRRFRAQTIQTTKQNSLKAIEKCNRELKVLNEEAIAKIKIVQSKGNTSQVAKQVIVLYEEVKKRILENDFDREPLIQYAKFLNTQHRFKEATKLYESLLVYYRSKKNQKFISQNQSHQWNAKFAQLCNNLANLYYEQGKYQQSEELYLEALNIRVQLVKENPEAYKDDLSNTYNDLGVLYDVLNKVVEAEEYYLKALKIRRELRKINLKMYGNLLAMTCNNLGLLYSNQKRYEESEKMHLEAISIRKKLIAENYSRYKFDIAISYDNLAILYHSQNRYSEAEEFYFKSLNIFKQLCQSNPDVYLGNVAKVYHNLGSLFFDSKKYKDAEELYLKALTIRRKLSESNPNVYLKYVAYTCDELSILYGKLNNVTAQEKYYKEALEIYRTLSKTNPNLYSSSIARICNNLGLIYNKQNRKEDAKNLYLEAIKIYTELSEKRERPYLSYLKIVKENLQLLHK